MARTFRRRRRWILSSSVGKEQCFDALMAWLREFEIVVRGLCSARGLQTSAIRCFVRFGSHYVKPVGGVPCFQNLRNPKPQTRILSLTGLFQEPEDLRELCCNAGALDRTTPCVRVRVCGTTGAVIVTYTFLGVPYYNYSIMGPKTPF